MASISNFALRLPPSLMVDVKAIAAHDSVSVNQFIVQAVAERVAVLRDRGYIAQRAARAKPGAMARILEMAGDDTPIPGDDLPEGWPVQRRLRNVPEPRHNHRCCNRSATRSPIMMDGRLVLVRVTRGMIEASAT